MLNKHHEHDNDRKDRNNREMQLYSFPHRHLSSSVDLSKYMTPIEHQEAMNTCCANAFAGVCEYLISRLSGRHIDVSRLFIYYNGQIISQRKLRVKDEGVRQRDIAAGLRKYGICEEKLWKYDTKLLNQEPPAHVYERASQFTVVALNLPCTIEAIETCLYNRFPVLIDIKLIDETGTQIHANQGYLEIPDLNSRVLEETRFHTVVIAGYDRKTRHFTVRNSWGKHWGHQGYFYMPYEYLSHPRLVNSSDGLWTILKIKPRTNRSSPVYRLALGDHRRSSHHHHH